MHSVYLEEKVVLQSTPTIKQIFPGARLVPSITTNFTNMPADAVVNEIPADAFTEIPLGTTDLSDTRAKGFCHYSQIDWLKAVKGSCVLTLFHNRLFYYIPMIEGMENYVEISRKVWHGALNFGETAQCYNLLFREGRKPHKDDYKLRTLPFNHSIEAAKKALKENKIILFNPITNLISELNQEEVANAC